MEKVVELFMNENDKEALTLLYDLTKDEIVKLALDWYATYYEELQYVYSNEFSMYGDLINHIWNKYELNKI